jgi:hypothetical protein
MKQRRPGLYGLAKISTEHPVKSGRYDVVGTVGDCERLANRALMVSGYCHYTDGPYIAVSQLHPAR